jgi:hypothetical protein
MLRMGLRSPALAYIMLRQLPAEVFDDRKGVRNADGISLPSDQRDGVV